MNTRQAKSVARINLKAGHGVLMVGSPGIGKTSILKQLAEELRISHEVWDAVSLDPTDIRGVLIPRGERSIFTKSAMLPTEGSGLLVIDELLSAAQQVQLALRPLFLEGKLGQDRIPQGWIPCATGNLATDDAGARQITTALADRLAIIPVHADANVWLEDYAVPAGLHPVVLGYIRHRPDMLSTFAKRNRSVTDRKQFATPRSHDRVSKILYAIGNEEVSDDLLLELFAGHVGDAVATDYVSYIRVYHDLEPADVIFAGKMYAPETLEAKYIFASAIPAAFERHPDRSEAADLFCKYIIEGPLDDEFKLLTIMDISRRGHAPILLKSRQIQKVARRFGEALRIRTGLTM